jgi:hypothetical protein
MKKLTMILILTFSFFITAVEANQGENMKISVNSNGNIIVFELNNSEASKELYSQLPISIKVGNFGDNEKIFYPSQKLSTINTPLPK